MDTYRVAYVQDVDPDQVLAVFPDSSEDCRPGRVLTYGVEEHNEADIAWVKSRPLAVEYGPLHNRLTRLYGPDGPAASAGAMPALTLVVDQQAVAAL